MGIIAKGVVNDFLTAKLDSFSWIKKSKRQDLLAFLDDTGYELDFKLKPFDHQLASIALGLEMPEFLFLLDMGTGKSAIALNIIAARSKAKEIKRTLVLVPGPANIIGWEEEIALHSDLTCTLLLGDRKAKNKALETESDIYVINYSGLQSIVTSLEKVAGRKSKQRTIDKKLLLDFSRLFDCIIFDELHMCKSTKSLTYRICQQLSKESSFRYGLTGTPFGRDPVDFWAEFFLVDRGETLGQTLGLYRAAYFEEKNNWFGGTEYTFNKKLAGSLARRLRHRSIRYADHECNDIPKKFSKNIVVEFPPDIKEKYQELIEKIIESKQNVSESENVFMQMRQIASGFIKLTTDAGEEIYVDFPVNPKMEALESLLSSLPAKRKMVIFYEFTKSGDMIEQMLKERKIKYGRLDGTVKDKTVPYKRFKEDPKCTVFMCNSKSGGTGLNFQVANYVTFYESPVSPIVRKQAEKRCHRTGQTRRTYIYSILVKDSVDIRIAEFIEEGKNLFDLLIEDKKGSILTRLFA